MIITADHITDAIKARSPSHPELPAIAKAAQAVCPTLGHAPADMTADQAMRNAMSLIQAARKAAKIVAKCPAAIDWPSNCYDAPKALCHWMDQATMVRVLAEIGG